MIQKGSIAPDFELFDTNLQKVKLSEIQGKVVFGLLSRCIYECL